MCNFIHRREFFHWGFSDSQLAENVFRIDFAGNKYTKKARALDFSLLRAAEICLDRGFRYFVISDKDKYEKVNMGIGETKGLLSRMSERSSVSYTIITYKDKPNVNGVMYDANFLARSIKEKYNIKN